MGEKAGEEREGISGAACEGTARQGERVAGAEQGGKARSHRALQSGARPRKAPLGPCWFGRPGVGPETVALREVPGAAGLGLCAVL